VIPDVNPGFSNRHGSNPGFAVPRQFSEGSQGTSMLEEYIRAMLPFVDPEQKIIMITSWNEWHEDTQVEPAIASAPTSQDISSSGHLYTWNYSYEGYGFENLELIRRLLASELPPVDTTLLEGSSAIRPPVIRIYPNPANDLVTIETTKTGPCILEIRAPNGSLLFHKPGNGPRHEVDLSAFPPGVYFLRFLSRDLMTTEKIVKL
jgi:hypothetical protein